MNVPFQKYVGAGNDFIFIKESDVGEKVDRSLLAEQLCRPQWGVGADGLVLFKPIDLEKNIFEWDFFNNDGSAAEMCGNAARCAVLFAHNTYGASSCKIKSKVGWLTGHIVDSENTSVSWSLSTTSTLNKEVYIGENKKIQGCFINTGVPHFVISAETLSEKECLLIQEHPDFSPTQTNVTLLYSKKNEHHTKSFERGVRNFTLACGTGVIASACVLKEKVQSDIYELIAPGGRLKVRFHESKIVELIGPAIQVFEGSITVRGI